MDESTAAALIAYRKQRDREKQRARRAAKKAAAIAPAIANAPTSEKPENVSGGASENPASDAASPASEYQGACVYAPEAPKKPGRPKLWTPQKATAWQDAICTWIREGKTLTAFVRRFPNGPTLNVIFGWRKESATFARLLELAQIDSADTLFAQSIDIIDASAGVSAPEISRARARSEVRRIAAAKFNPERYAEKTTSVTNATVKHVITDDQRAIALAAFIARQAIAEGKDLHEVRRLIEGKTAKDQPEQ